MVGFLIKLRINVKRSNIFRYFLFVGHYSNTFCYKEDAELMYSLKKSHFKMSEVKNIAVCF